MASFLCPSNDKLMAISVITEIWTPELRCLFLGLVCPGVSFRQRFNARHLGRLFAQLLFAFSVCTALA